jgi:hypothetical protein
MFLDRAGRIIGREVFLGKPVLLAIDLSGAPARHPVRQKYRLKSPQHLEQKLGVHRFDQVEVNAGILGATAILRPSIASESNEEWLLRRRLLR